MGGDEVAGDDLQYAAAMVLDGIDDEVEATLRATSSMPSDTGSRRLQRDLIQKRCGDVRGRLVVVRRPRLDDLARR